MSRDRTARRRVLVLVQDELGPRTSGPGVRGLGLARALAASHDVTVAAQGTPPAVLDGIPTVPYTRRRVTREALRHDVVVAPTVPPYLLAVLRLRGATVVSDLYDPVDLEYATMPDSAAIRRTARTASRSHALQLRFADVLLCAGERQRERLDEQVRATSRRCGEPAVRTVPLGLDDAAIDEERRPLRECFPAIGADDRVVLWWGSLWRWFDPHTVLNAFVGLRESHPHIKLVMTASKPGVDVHGASVSDEARATAARLGLEGESVFFLDEWVPYGERHHILHEADVGITLHAATAEAALAMRARVLDYLWCALPCVLAEGDEVTAQLGEAGFARVVPAGDPEAVARAIVTLADDPDALVRAREAGREVAARWRWEAVAQPLAETLGDLAITGSRRRGLARVLPAVTGYYAARAHQQLAAATKR